MSYQLEVLNDKDFEELCKDLLEREIGLLFQIFKTGADKGIDLRYAADQENQVIVQAKHYIRSKYSDLKTALVREKANMDDLSPQPSRYILMTTLDLSVDQIDEVTASMAPHLLNSQDIYAKERIVNLIAKYGDVQKKYYKLWLTSTRVMETVLHNAVNGRSEFFQKKILDKVSRYVPTISFQQAVDKLNEHHFLIISGEPGIGKTTISYLLMCDMMANGYQMIYVDDLLSDAEDVMGNDPDRKQVVFFDDFFGHNLSEILNPRNSESKIVGFIERIKDTPNKMLVMTTRTTILNQAEARFERFHRAKFGEMSKYELCIEAYSQLDKAKILYYHLYHSGLPAAQYDIFFKSKNYLKIIDHRNYFPRLIEHITTKENLQPIKTEKVEDQIFYWLENPSLIWEYAFNEELTGEEQFLLITLFSLGGYQVGYATLEKAFEARLSYEIEFNGYQRKLDIFRKSLKKLMNGFITAHKHLETGYQTFSFLNPSVGDFMIHYLKARPAEQKRILFSAAYTRQITNYFMPGITNGIVFPAEHLAEFYERFQILAPKMIGHAINTNACRLIILRIYVTFFLYHVDQDTLMSELTAIDPRALDGVAFSELKDVLDQLDEFPDAEAHIRGHWTAYFIAMVELAEDSMDIHRIIRLLRIYGIAQEEWEAEETFMKVLMRKVNECYASTANDLDIQADEEEIVTAYRESGRSDAIWLVQEKMQEDYSVFLKDCGLEDFHDEFVTEVDFDGDILFSKVIDEDYDHDDYEPGLQTPAESFPWDDEEKKIERLFER